MRGIDVHTWVLMLAGGDGRRLQGITRDTAGRAVPKQYCDFGTGRSLLGRTVDRALSFAPRSHVVAIVARQHRDWWRRDLDAIPAGNVIVQPENRGTAAGLLLPLLWIHARDPQATVLVLPSDHHIQNERALHDAVAGTMAAIDRHPGAVMLLGIVPDYPDTEYGWVLPDGRRSALSRPVATFVEKPGRPDAIRLMARGALWNSFMLAGRSATMIGMFQERLPELLGAMSNVLAGGSEPALAAFYRSIEPRDFSRDVLQAMPERLRVIPVPACGWTDLGTPDRLARLWHGAHLETQGAGAQSAA